MPLREILIFTIKPTPKEEQQRCKNSGRNETKRDILRSLGLKTVRRIKRANQRGRSSSRS